MKRGFILISESSIKSFTLIELIVVIIIVGILAAVGMTQYSTIVEKSRLAEAKIRIGTMRQLAQEYYLNNGVLDSITNADVGVDNTCTSTGFYRYLVGGTATYVHLQGVRCTSGGKTPNGTRQYVFEQVLWPGTGDFLWRCGYGPGEPCFGYPNCY